MTSIRTAQQFFLPQHDGDHSAFQPYALGDVEPNQADMHSFILVVFDGAHEYLAARNHRRTVGKRQALRLAEKAYREDPAYAEELRAWCMAEAQRAYTAHA